MADKSIDDRSAKEIAKAIMGGDSNIGKKSAWEIGKIILDAASLATGEIDNYKNATEQVEIFTQEDTRKRDEQQRLKEADAIAMLEEERIEALKNEAERGGKIEDKIVTEDNPERNEELMEGNSAIEQMEEEDVVDGWEDADREQLEVENTDGETDIEQIEEDAADGWEDVDREQLEEEDTDDLQELTNDLANTDKHMDDQDDKLE